MDMVTGVRCECSDPECPINHGHLCTNRAVEILYRIDMEDETGTAFCEECASDAFDSGLFVSNEDQAEILREDEE